MESRRIPPRGHVRVRPNGGQGYEVTIPVAVAKLVGADRLFRVELVDEGILLRYVEGGEPVSLPDWLT